VKSEKFATALHKKNARQLLGIEDSETAAGALWGYATTV
jgi:hypothetical protein